MLIRNLIVTFIIVAVVLLLEMFLVLRYGAGFTSKDAWWISNKNFVSNQYHDDNENCEVIHIGIVCMRYESHVDIHNMVKSLLFYRNNPLCFHILVDDISEKSLKTLFETWAVPQVEVMFYNINSFMPDIKWISTDQRYLGINEYMKMLFPKQIPLNVTSKIIVIDADILYNGDIYELWNFFDDFDEKQVIAVAENQNSSHLNSEEQGAAVRKGFNTEVILYNLKKLEVPQWTNLLDKAINTVATQEKTTLTNRAVINAIIRNNSHLVYRLPCNWNVQQAQNAISHHCYNNNHIKIIHWNSLKNVKVITHELDYLKSMRTMLLEYNGNLLRRQLYCKQFYKNSPKTLLSSPCLYNKEVGMWKWRTLLFIRKFEHNATDHDVTFVSQLSFDKRGILEEVSRRWNGPMSIAIYITDSQLQECIQFIENSKLLQTRSNIAYHIVFKEGNFYPINTLRNTALRNVITPYVFLNDIDFLPMQNLHLNLQKYMRKVENKTKQAYIVPAFQTRKLKTKIPSTTEALLSALYKNVFPFSCKEFPPGHGPTNFTKWSTAEEPYQIKWQRSFEPYVVVQKNVAEYDERFVGYRWNKVSHILELEAQGYEFIVLPKVFVVHKYHLRSRDFRKIQHTAKFRKCMDKLYNEYIREREKKYGRKFNSK